MWLWATLNVAVQWKPLIAGSSLSVIRFSDIRMWQWRPVVRGFAFTLPSSTKKTVASRTINYEAASVRMEVRMRRWIKWTVAVSSADHKLFSILSFSQGRSLSISRHNMTTAVERVPWARKTADRIVYACSSIDVFLKGWQTIVRDYTSAIGKVRCLVPTMTFIAEPWLTESWRSGLHSVMRVWFESSSVFFVKFQPKKKRERKSYIQKKGTKIMENRLTCRSLSHCTFQLLQSLGHEVKVFLKLKNALLSLNLPEGCHDWRRNLL